MTDKPVVYVVYGGKRDDEFLDFFDGEDIEFAKNMLDEYQEDLASYYKSWDFHLFLSTILEKDFNKWVEDGKWPDYMLSFFNMCDDTIRNK